MRIPTSLIVMSVVTAVPFGLAIRDSLHGERRYTAAERDEQAMREERATYEARMEAERERADRAEREAHEAALAHVGLVFGPQRATLGHMFERIQIGQGMADYTDIDANANANDMDFDVSVGDDLHVDWISVSLRGDDTVCEQLRAKIIAAWGPPLQSTWLADDGTQRARLDGCKLRIERTVPVTRWVSEIMAIAKSAASDADDVMLPGVGNGAGPTTITHQDDKTVVVSASTDFDTSVAIREALAAQLEQPPKLDDGAWVWRKRGIVITLVTAAGSSELTLRFEVP